MITTTMTPTWKRMKSFHIPQYLISGLPSTGDLKASYLNQHIVPSKMTPETDPLLSTVDGSSSGLIRIPWGPLGAPAFAVVKSALVDGSFNGEIPYVPRRRSVLGSEHCAELQHIFTTVGASNAYGCLRPAAGSELALYTRYGLSSWISVSSDRLGPKSLFPCSMAYQSRSMRLISIDHSASPLALRGLCLTIMARAITEWIFLTLKWLECFCQALNYIIEVRAKRA